ncbi:WecB/TagA/CpsF family glycosyltransferase [Pseudomonas sp. GCEP-101]|uniref:WecB/TagA/CpsF family glycosyltransferase n=1 Tax=Pseudomonas sp. GCEP-101 TaxID=2974552 RepID=UPI00223BC29C|nr:WecB/TagA/CpsF family glycosyltransferase [Pseudomonas sp. GCEP-101]
MKSNIQSNFNYTLGKLYTFINPYSFKKIMTSSEKDRILSNFLFHPDGISLCVLLKIFGRKIDRVSFDDTSIAPIVFNYAAVNRLKLGMIGSSPTVIAKAKDIIQERYEIQDITINSGYFPDSERELILRTFLDCDIVISSMGTPKQELSLLDLREMGWHGTGFTCGGFFDQITNSSGKSYYPNFIDRLHLRWAYRIFKEPKRLWHRYAFDYPIGALYFIRHLI